jgi:cellobiose PTS system EIIB component
MKVLLVCSGGMSTSIIVKALKKEAENHGAVLEAAAVGSNEIDREINSNWDLVMVAPQVRHRFDQIKAAADKASLPCEIIPVNAYNPLGAPVLFKKIQELLGS